MSEVKQQIQAVERTLKNEQSARRWRHTEGVAETAAEIARRHDLPVKRCRLAGLLHDCAKELVSPSLEELVERGAVDVDGFTLRTPGLHHTVLGTWRAREEFGVEDTEVLEAIRYHSHGACGMGTIAAVIFLADWIEPNRSFAERETLAQQSRTDLEGALLATAAAKMMRGLSRQRAVHPLALAYYNERVAVAADAQCTLATVEACG